jgi:hypothetical protein
MLHLYGLVHRVVEECSHCAPSLRVDVVPELARAEIAPDGDDLVLLTEETFEPAIEVLIKQ